MQITTTDIINNSGNVRNYIRNISLSHILKYVSGNCESTHILKHSSSIVYEIKLQNQRKLYEVKIRKFKK